MKLKFSERWKPESGSLRKLASSLSKDYLRQKQIYFYKSWFMTVDYFSETIPLSKGKGSKSKTFKNHSLEACTTNMPVKEQPGGMFNSYKVQYSPETHKLLKLLMDEAKLTNAQRQQMNKSLKRGEPLPVIRRRRFRPSYVDENLFDLKKNYYFQRRSQDQIMNSGAYERERYRFLERNVDLEKEKEKLRNMMEYGKNKVKEKRESKNVKETPNQETKKISLEERLEELVSEIKDRLEFLKEMETLGQAKNYEQTIKQEIAAKLREMKKIDKNLAEKYLSALELSKESKNSDKDKVTEK